MVARTTSLVDTLPRTHHETHSGSLPQDRGVGGRSSVAEALLDRRIAAHEAFLSVKIISVDDDETNNRFRNLGAEFNYPIKHHNKNIARPCTCSGQFTVKVPAPAA